MAETDFTLEWKVDCGFFRLARSANRLRWAPKRVAPRQSALAIEAVDETMTSEDAQEGVAAFLQKREPSFKHR